MTEEPREDPGEHLYRSVVMTAVSRFNASRRLKLHGEWTLWSISLCSLYLIVISLIQHFDFNTRLSESEFSFMQIVASLVILLFSTALSGYRFGERSEKMHDCALKLNALGRDVEFAIHNERMDKLEELRKSYESILTSHENHLPNDWQQATFKRFREHYNLGWRDLAKMKTIFYGQFLHYALLNAFFSLMLIISVF